MIKVPASPLTDLELALGYVIGNDPSTPSISPGEFAVETPRDAFRGVLRGALERGTCFVSFSGGRDSSTVFAVAVDVAREAGLPLPVPVTKIMPDLPSSDESDWQELVLRHLGVQQRERVLVHVYAGDDEIFGADGLESLQRIGVSYPAAASSVLSVLRATSGGTLLTGNGGDELGAAANSQWAARALAEGRASRRTRLAARMPRMAAVARGARALAARPVDHLYVSPWLTWRAEAAVRRTLAASDARQATDWRGLLSDFPRSRRVVVGEQSLTRLAEPYNVSVCNPFWERRTLSALGAAREFVGYPTRAAVLEDLLGELLPTAVTRRTTKADFTATPWGPEAENFIRSWDGSNVPSQYVDPDVLRAEWNLPPAERSVSGIPLLQSAWLASQR